MPKTRLSLLWALKQMRTSGEYDEIEIQRITEPFTK